MNERSAAVDGTGGGSRTVTLVIPAKPEYIALSRLALTGLARVRPFADDTLSDLKLALTEAMSNSVRHAYANGEGQVEISFELCEDRLIVEVSDDGPGFEHGAFQREAAGHGTFEDGAGEDGAGEDEAGESRATGGNGLGGQDLSEGGLGIAIIRSIADELEIGSGPRGGSRLRFVKLL